MKNGKYFGIASERTKQIAMKPPARTEHPVGEMVIWGNQPVQNPDRNTSEFGISALGGSR
jgi:hypothetical protein